MIAIRTATHDDIPALVRLLGQLFAQEAEFHPDDRAQARGLAAILADARIGSILIAEHGDKPVGMANLLYTVSTALGGRVAILEDMVIDEECRGAGFGRALLAAAIERARADGCLRITLLTDTDNARAQRLYGSFGFKRSAMVPFRLMLERTLVG